MTAASTKISDELAAELAAVAANCDCELAHLELKSGVLRLILDRLEGGISLEDCARVSRQASALLDAHEFGSARYTLEVSSPGLDRQLYGPRDYQRFVGSLVRVTYFAGEERAKRTVVARLEAFRPEPVAEIEIVEETKQEALSIPLDRIKLARLEIVL
jgi:ribosome maturation factor RimP